MTIATYFLKYTPRLIWFGIYSFISLGPLTACSGSEEMKTVKWREEVQLSNGQVIVADQMESFRPEQVALAKGALYNTYRMQATFPMPISTTVVWEGLLKPLAIDVATDKQIYLVTIIGTRQAEREYKPTDGFHVAFRYSKTNHWERIPLESVPSEIKQNLLISMGELFLKQSYPTNQLVNLSVKQKVDADPGIDSSNRSWGTK